MSAIEEACRWSIVQGYCVWVHRHRHLLQLRWLSMVAYARALDLEPTWPPQEDTP